jgi:hypothetical protein
MWREDFHNKLKLVLYVHQCEPLLNATFLKLVHRTILCIAALCSFFNSVCKYNIEVSCFKFKDFYNDQICKYYFLLAIVI